MYTKQKQYKEEQRFLEVLNYEYLPHLKLPTHNCLIHLIVKRLGIKNDFSIDARIKSQKPPAKIIMSEKWIK